MDSFAKVSHNVHRNKMDDILQQAEKVVKLFIKCRWPNIWSDIQENFQTQNEFNRLRLMYPKIDVNPNPLDPLDLSTICYTLKNARKSPICCLGNSKNSMSVYFKDTWDAPIVDVQTKFEHLQNILRAKFNLKKFENGNDVKQIFALLEEKGEINPMPYLKSYFQLLKTNQIQEAVLNANLNENGIHDVLSVLKLAFPSMNCIDYGFVLYLGMLKDRRNHLTHSRDEDLTMAMHRKEFDIINQCIKNILCLIKNDSNSSSMDMDEFQYEIEKNIEDILAGHNVDAAELRNPVTLLKQNSAIGVKNNSQITERSQSLTEPAADGKIYCDHCKLYLLPVDADNHFKGKQHEKKMRLTHSATASDSLVVAAKANSLNISSGLNKDCVPKYSAEVVQKSQSVAEKVQKVVGSSDDGEIYYCKVCDKHFSGILPKQEHDLSDKHRKKVLISSNGTDTPPNANSFVPSEENKKRAVQNLMNVFFESFDPFPRVCLLLKSRNVFTSVDVDTIRKPSSKDEKIDEFFRVIQLKRDWFESLTAVLMETNYQALVGDLKEELRKMSIEKK